MSPLSLFNVLGAKICNFSAFVGAVEPRLAVSD
jgi:hypothetical protein